MLLRPVDQWRANAFHMDKAWAGQPSFQTEKAEHVTAKSRVPVLVRFSLPP
jgi:hypothetical protein